MTIFSSEDSFSAYFGSSNGGQSAIFFCEAVNFNAKE
jgi:hypothetical protein